jgi:hypothetical protein
MRGPGSDADDFVNTQAMAGLVFAVLLGLALLLDRCGVLP